MNNFKKKYYNFVPALRRRLRRGECAQNKHPCLVTWIAVVEVKKPMRKVLIFSTAYLPFIGGAEIAVKELTDRMGDYEFDLITARLDRHLPKHEKIGRVNVFRLGWGGKFDKFLLPGLGLGRALALNRRQNYAIIFSLMASQASIAAVFFKIIQPAKKLILDLQEGDEEEHLKRYTLGSDILYNLLIRPWHLMVFKKADLIIAISNYLRLRALANGAKCPIEVVPNGVNLEKFAISNFKVNFNPPAGGQTLKLKQELNIKETDRILITTSRLVKKNAVDDLIKSLKYLPVNVKLLILGHGPDRQMLDDLTRRLTLENRIIFLGQIGQADLVKYLALADIFVRPSLSEGQGISFLEAMAAGLPVIATPVGGIVDFLRDGQTGLFCEVKNPESIALKVKIYLADKDLTEKIKANASELVKNNYDWNLLALKMKTNFEKIILES